jgi:hypothetical protein
MAWKLINDRVRVYVVKPVWLTLGLEHMRESSLRR